MLLHIVNHCFAVASKPFFITLGIKYNACSSQCFWLVRKNTIATCFIKTRPLPQLAVIDLWPAWGTIKLYYNWKFDITISRVGLHLFTDISILRVRTSEFWRYFVLLFIVILVMNKNCAWRLDLVFCDTLRDRIRIATCPSFSRFLQWKHVVMVTFNEGTPLYVKIPNIIQFEIHLPM